MFKFFGKKFGRGSPGSNSNADFSEKFFLEKHCTHGFPLSPTCMTFDEHRRVVHIGTASGEIRVVGQPGVELTGTHDDGNKVLQILPFASEPSLIVVCANNIMHKWSLVDSEGVANLVLKRTYKFQGGLAKTITTCCLPAHCDCLFVGTLGGITYPMDTEFDGMSPEVLSWSRARAYLKYEGRDVPGEVRTLNINPTNPKQLLIGYEHNYLELWDALTWKPIMYFGVLRDKEVGDLLAASWSSVGTQFVTTHKDGSFLFFDINSDSTQPFRISRPHGTECVQDMGLLLWPKEGLLIVSGGAPLSLVDGHCISILEGDEVCALQLTSPVRAIHVLEGVQQDKDSGIVNFSDNHEGDSSVTNKRVLILLLEQEILFIELSLPELPLLRPPYFYSIHNSPVKCMEVYESVPKEVWQTINQAGKVQLDIVYASRTKTWPIDGGVMEQVAEDSRDLLVTGHEDGTIKFWDISTLSMRLLYVLKSLLFFNSLDSDFFKGDVPDNENVVKQVSFWDPRSDDDQVQVSCMQFYGDQMLVGFVGGSVLLLNLKKQSATVVIPMHRVSILREDPRQRGRNWHAPMELRLDGVECGPGYQPVTCVTLFPNVSITAIGFAKDHQLMAIGCMYGFAVVDSLKNTTLHIGSTYVQFDEELGNLSRMQSIRKSFRQSLKRLNIRRSMHGQSLHQSYRPALVRSGSMRPSMKHRTNVSSPGGVAGMAASPAISHETSSMPPRRDSVKAITFSAPSQLAGHSPLPSMVVGTNQGGVLAFSIDVPSSKQRESKSPVLMPIEKEFNLKKNFSVVFCGILDHQQYLLDINDPGSYHHNPSKGGQWIVIVMEDSVKVLGLPSLRKKFRLRLKSSDVDEYYAQSGHLLRVRGHSFLAIMGSDGFVCVYSLPELRLVSKQDCVEAADAVGQRNFTLTQRGLLLHMRSPSELTRGSISEQSRMEFHFNIPSKSIDKLVLGPRSPSREPTTELSVEQETTTLPCPPVVLVSTSEDNPIQVTPLPDTPSHAQDSPFHAKDTPSHDSPNPDKPSLAGTLIKDSTPVHTTTRSLENSLVHGSPIRHLKASYDSTDGAERRVSAKEAFFASSSYSASLDHEEGNSFRERAL